MTERGGGIRGISAFVATAFAQDDADSAAAQWPLQDQALTIRPTHLLGNIR